MDGPRKGCHKEYSCDSIKMFSFLVIVTLVAAANAKSIFPNGRIVGGDNAAIETYPYQISLERYGNHHCGGSIVSEHYIVTAGHCVGSPAQYLTVRAGSSIMNEGGSIHQVDKVIRHEKYSSNRYGVPLNDVALLHVKQPFKFDETRQPIGLFEIDEEAAAGVSSVITGWGNTGSGLSSQLQTVSIPIVTKKLCSTAYKGYGGLPDGQICAAYYGVGGKDACQGDSGGPLAIDGRLAGIVSWGSGCAKPNYPGVYTEVAHFREWINQRIEN